MPPFRNLVCPQCGKTSRIPNLPGFRATEYTCPSCHYAIPLVAEPPVQKPVQNPEPQPKPQPKPQPVQKQELKPAQQIDLNDFVPFQQRPVQEETPQPTPKPAVGTPPKNFMGETTEFSAGFSDDPGAILIMGEQRTVALKVGNNVIGRDADTSKADIRINTFGSKRMSREHLVIEVKKLSVGGTLVSAYLAKHNTNGMRINGKEIVFGDKIPLSPDDVISLPGADIKYIKFDEDSTQYQA